MLHFSTFLSSTFTHLNTGRIDWKKKTNTAQRLLTKQFCSVTSRVLYCLFQAPAFMASPNCFVSRHWGSRYWSSLSSPDTWPTGLFAKQLVKALLPHTVFEGYRRNTPEAEMWYPFTPRLSWFRLCKPQGAAQEVHLLNITKYQRSLLQNCSEALEFRAIYMRLRVSPYNFIRKFGLFAAYKAVHNNPLNCTLIINLHGRDNCFSFWHGWDTAVQQ